MNPFLYAGHLDLDPNVFNHETCAGDLHVAYGRLRYYRMKSRHLVDHLRHLGNFDPFWVECDNVPIRPHTDLRITVALNLYVHGGGATTTFWEPKAGEEANAWPQDTSPNPVKNMWREDQLNPVGSFLAEPGDAYWLDVTKIHSVDGIAHGETRQFVQLCWSRVPFEQIAQSL